MSERPPVGAPVDPRPAQRPERRDIEGQYVTLTPLDASSHAPALFEQLCGPSHSVVWTYMPKPSSGDFDSLSQFIEHLEPHQASTDPVFYTIIPKRDLPGTSGAKAGTPVGFISYLNIEPAHRSVEIGFVTFAPAALQRTTEATEVLGLMMRHAFEGLGYRRVEWKCDALNRPSRRAAERLGFVYEGLFRQHRIVRARNRDTAWYSVTDEEWADGGVGAALEKWLDPENFKGGKQIKTLEQIRAELRGGK